MKPEPKYDDPGLHLTPFGRRALLIGIIIALAIAIVWALTDTAGAQEEWDRSSISLDGRCLPDGTAEFVVTNTGADMAGPSAWREYEDDVSTQSGEFTLAANGAQTRTFASNGVLIRFEADQRIGHPGASAPRLALACEKHDRVTLREFKAPVDGCSPPSVRRASWWTSWLRPAGTSSTWCARALPSQTPTSPRGTSG